PASAITSSPAFCSRRLPNSICRSDMMRTRGTPSLLVSGGARIRVAILPRLGLGEEPIELFADAPCRGPTVGNSSEPEIALGADVRKWGGPHPVAVCEGGADQPIKSLALHLGLALGHRRSPAPNRATVLS